jgi:hypothetical protein
MTDDAKDRLEPASCTPADRLRRDMASFNARRQISPLLQAGVLPADISQRLAIAIDAGSAVGPDIAAHLHRLRDLGAWP